MLILRFFVWTVNLASNIGEKTGTISYYYSAFIGCAIMLEEQTDK